MEEKEHLQLSACSRTLPRPALCLLTRPWASMPSEADTRIDLILISIVGSPSLICR